MDQVTLDKWNNDQKPAVLHVSEISAIISDLLADSRLSRIWVTGEITNFKRHSSGHLYFSLSDNRDKFEAVISCSIWKSSVRYLGFTPEDGMEVQAYGSVNHYEPGGRYSFQITQMRPSGAGEKALLIEQWKREMSAKGWFNSERKRPLPQYPQKVGVVTSPTGAVIKDIKNVFSVRFPVEIILSPATVQGPLAHEEIARAIRRVEKLVDLIIVGRGGGSFEDLFSFNHPEVVKAIVNCPVPVVAAIGHEVDITLADLAADFRASTPSHAAERSVPDRRSELDQLIQVRKMMYHLLIGGLETAEEDINHLRDRLSSPGLMREIFQRREYLADLTDRMTRAQTAHLSRKKMILDGQKSRLEGKNPRMLIVRELPEKRVFITELSERLGRSVLVRLNEKKMELNAVSAIISSHSPEALSNRGYCIVRKDNTIITSVLELSAKDLIKIRFADGTANATIGEVCHDKKV